jgi:rubrerythrin
MPQLKGSKTQKNLKDAFAGESMANRRYLYFAKVADVEGYPEIAGNFRDTAEGETGHTQRHLDYLKKVDDATTDLRFGDTVVNL